MYTRQIKNWVIENQNVFRVHWKANYPVTNRLGIIKITRTNFSCYFKEK